MATPISTDAILKRMAESLPTHPAGDESSDLASSYEVIGLLVHSYISILGFRLSGFREDQTLAECDSLAPRLPSSWNSGFGSLSFVYRHKQSAMTFVFKVDRMGAKVEIRGLAAGAENIYRFERTVRDVVVSSQLPLRISLNDSGAEDRSDLPDRLRAVFASADAIESIVTDIRVKLIQKLIPKLQAEGYEETAEAEADATQERRDQEAQNPLRPFPRGPVHPAGFPQPNPMPDLARPRPLAPTGEFPPPGFEDPYDIHRPPGGVGGLVMPGRSPYNIGHDDLNPPGLGPNDPFRPAFTGGLPRPGGGMGGGMHPTFDDPLFGGQGGMGGSGQGFDPQAPPGARWDPLGPGGRGPRFPGQGGGNGGFGGPFGGGDII